MAPRPRAAQQEVERPLAQPRWVSFRDPAGTVLVVRDRILRLVPQSGVPCLEAYLQSEVARRYESSGRLVGSRVLSSHEVQELASVGILADDGLVLEHEPVWFPSFPYEWPPEMLHAAGRLTLDLAADLLEEGRGLKDATPYNVLFRGPQPVFIDVLSIEDRDPKDPVWLAYAQFIRTFVLPLLANKFCGMPVEVALLSRRDGLEPEEVYRWLTWRQRLRPALLSQVSVPTWLGRWRRDDLSLYRSRRVADPEKARFILRVLLARLRRLLVKCVPPCGSSSWSAYETSHTHYSAEQWAAKESFVRRVLRDFRPSRVLDVGCNVGGFSLMAAKCGAQVVAIDRDAAVVGELWRRAIAEQLDVLPLVVDFARPSPAVGWRNRECPSFLDRARGQFDLVMMLAMLHHLVVSERIPVSEVLGLAAELTSRLLLIEYVDPQDRMFRRIARGRDELHRDLTLESFKAVCSAQFRVLESFRLADGDRWLFLLEKKSSPE